MTDHTSGGTRAIDRSVLGEWLAGDDHAINAMLVIFRDSALAEHLQMRDALVRNDLSELVMAAHRLRGGALSMGARTLAQAAAKVETAARNRDAALCAGGMPEVEVQLDLMVAEVPAETETQSEETPLSNQSASGR
jgi:two-component system sensor histidine kinase/response regulator